MCRVLDKPHLVQVARAIRKDLACRDAYDEHGPGVLGTQGIIRRDAGRAIHADALRILEIQEQQPDMGVDEYVSPGSVHAVPVVIRNGQSAIVQDADEPGQAALVGAVGVAVGISGSNEEHRTALNERAVLVGECGTNGYLRQPIGDGPRFARILKLAHSSVIHQIVSHYSARLNAGRSAQRPHHAATRGWRSNFSPNMAPIASQLALAMSTSENDPIRYS